MQLTYYETPPITYDGMLLKGISDHAWSQKALPAIKPLHLFITDSTNTVLGGLSGATFYGSLYIDSLWVDPSCQQQGWGSQLLAEAEKISKQRGSFFSIVHTMDWEAPLFYQKFGYVIEFIREGYEKDSRMYMLRKNL